MKLCLGDALIRNPASLIDVSKKFVNSSQHAILTSGAQAAEAITISNPDYQGVNGSESTTLTGASAYMKIVANSIAGTGYSGMGSNNPLNDLLDAYKSGTWPDQTDAGAVGSSGAPMIKHGNITYIFDPTAPSLGKRAVALNSELSEEERLFYIERGTLLNRTIADPVLVNGFDIDFPDSWAGNRFTSTQTFFPDVAQSSDGRYVATNLISAAKQKAYIATSLIELLLILVDKIGINGNFGTAKAILPTTADPATGFIDLPFAGETGQSGSISDHVFGRAFDITNIGVGAESIEQVSTSDIKYETQLDVLFQALNSVPMSLLPDLIVMHPEVGRKMGVAEGLEGLDNAIKIKYPNLKYVNFHMNEHHKDHIHLSFGAERAGKYVGSDGLIMSTTAGGNETGSEDPEVIAALKSGKVKALTNYKNSPAESFSLTEMFAILTEKFFSQEAAAIMCAVMKRESNYRPGSFNGKCSFKEDGNLGGDYSIGFFQFNLVPYVKKGKESSKLKVLFDGTTMLDKPKEIQASHLAYAPGATADWTSTKIGQKMVSLQNAGKAYTDDLVWYPINQVGFVAYSKFGYNNSPINDSAGFYHWGDYSDRSDCGFIFGTKFQDAVSVYLTTGKDIALLIDWVKKQLPIKNKKTAPYIEQWMAGAVFRSKPVSGSLLKETTPIRYVAAGSSGSSSSGTVVRKIDKNLAIIGDYLVEESLEVIKTKVANTPWVNFTVEGKRGRTGIKTRQVQTIKSVRQVIGELNAGEQKPDAYIISAGNTEAILYSNAASYKAMIQAVMTAIGKKPTYWFKIYNNTTTQDVTRSVLFNTALDEVAVVNKNVLVNSVTEWDDNVVASPSLLVPAQRSLSALGKDTFSSLIEQAANNLAATLVPGSYSYSSGSTEVPTFAKTQIAEAATWLRENRMEPWELKYNSTFGCEGFANRLASGLGILGAVQNYDIFTNEWEEEVTSTLARNDSAQSHYNLIKNKKTIFFPASTAKGKNPPAGYLVFWTGGIGDVLNLGHVGISLGNGTFIDQNGNTPANIIGSDKAGAFPGVNYKYVGSSSSWI